MIVADAGPLIVCSRIGRLSLLHQVFETLIIPDAVYTELIVRGEGRAGVDEIAQSEWIRHESIRDRTALQAFPDVLAQGEREAIVLAEERQAPLLLDDYRARREAESRGIVVVGVLWILGEAKRRGLVSEVRPLIDDLLSVGYWLHPERVVRPFLEAMNEL
jgi:predicted nucleic acid-binding protein